MKSNWKSLLILFGLMTWMSCKPTSLGSPKPISARTLAEEYDRSNVAARSKYDGKEVIVSGHALLAATLTGDDQGSVLLDEKESPLARKVTCWFSKDQAGHFSKIKAGDYVTVKGIFNGEGGAELKFCKLVPD